MTILPKNGTPVTTSRHIKRPFLCLSVKKKTYLCGNKSALTR